MSSPAPTRTARDSNSRARRSALRVTCAPGTPRSSPAQRESRHRSPERGATSATVPAVNGEPIQVGDTTVRFLVERADSGGGASVFEAGIRAQGRMPAPHSHDGFEETVYGLEGISTWTVDGTSVDVAP